ncbi:MAG: UDP-N-acetylmuramoyl-L-alanine--D-glutamate ligase [Hyphomicrobiaceae bacterium]
MQTLNNVSRVGIWGYGREGRSVLEFLRKNFPRLTVSVLVDVAPGHIGEMPSDVQLLVGDKATASIRSGFFDLIIKSPGISLYRREITEAKKNGVKVTSSTNLWFEKNGVVGVIGVTGTKGKSTSSRLIHSLLGQAGLEGIIAGNVGIPILDCIPGKDYTVIELSSYQIADLCHAAPIAVIGNLYPEHGPWHGGHEQYFHDKLRIAHRNTDQIVVANSMDDRLRVLLADYSNVVWGNSESGFSAKGGRLFYGQQPVDTAGFPLQGEHNLINLAMALGACEAFGVRQFHKKVDLSSFTQLPHRLEEFSSRSGMLCVNDSISTIPEAVIAALKTYQHRDILLILGGTERGQDYDELLSFLQRIHVRAVALLPETGHRLHEAIRTTTSLDSTLASDMESAITFLSSRAKSNDIVLLSPGAPSFGGFTDFEERGKIFQELCRDLL